MHEQLNSAIRERRQLLIVFCSSSGGMTSRVVQPERITERAGNLYLIAWLPMHGKRQTFRVDEIDLTRDAA